MVQSAVPKNLLPAEIDGWEPADKDDIYLANNLHEYINGAAELYISYGLVKMVSRIYLKENEPDIIVEIFDMGSPQNAFGIFSHTREMIDTAFGQGSQYTAGLLLFWKDRFYVSILCSPETEATKKAVFKLAKKIDRAILREGKMPDILRFLPADSLIKESIRYFRHPAWLNTYYYISDQNILRINDNTEALLAKYGSQKEALVLLIVKYSQKQDAQKAFENFVGEFLPELNSKSVVQLEDGRWATAELHQDVIVIVLNAGSEKLALSLLKKVDKRVSVLGEQQ